MALEITKRLKAARLGAVVLALALLVWCVGPSLGLGELHPLRGVQARLAVLLVGGLWAGLRYAGRPAHPAIALGGVLSLWYLGPALAIGGVHPLRPFWARAGVVALIAGVYLAWVLYRIWSRLQQDAQFARRVLGPFSVWGKDAQRAADAGLLEQQTREALKRLQQLERAGGARSWRVWLRNCIDPKGFLDKRAWILLLGDSGAGKTSLVTHAGLRLQPPEPQAVMPTRGCDWWLCDGAVLLDTAGDAGADVSGTTAQRPPSDLPAHAAAPALAQPQPQPSQWRAWARMLGRLRSSAPLDAVVLAVDCEVLLGEDLSGRQRLAARMRARLEALREDLGAEVPVYVVVTKMDRLHGFDDYFAGLDARERQHVLGFALSAAEGAGEGADAGIAHHMRALRYRLQRGRDQRLQEEFSLPRRCALYALEQEIDALCVPLSEWVDGVVPDPARRALRGVYFTSACRSGSPPVGAASTLLGAMGQVTRLDDQSPPNQATYFVAGLMRHIMAARPGRLRSGPSAWTRPRLMRAGAVVVVAAVTALGVWALQQQYGHGRSYLRMVEQQRAVLQGVVAQRAGGDAPPERRVAALAAARDLSAQADQGPSGGIWAWPYANHIQAPIRSAAAGAEQHLLETQAVPVLSRALRGALHQAVLRRDFGDTHDLLEAYLMLHDAAHYDPKRLQAIWLGLGAQADRVEALPPQLRLLRARPEILFAPRRVMHDPQPMDEALVGKARALMLLRAAPERVYRELKTAWVAADPATLRLAGLVGVGPPALHEGDAHRDDMPSLFTREAYLARVLPDLRQRLARALRDDDWLTGQQSVPVNQEGDAALATLRQQVMRLYFEDYAKHWQELLDGVEFVPVSDLVALQQLVHRLSEPDSPLFKLLAAVVHHTTLQAEDPARPGGDAFEDTDGLFVSVLDPHFKHLRTVAGGEAGAGDPTSLLREYAGELSLRLVESSQAGEPPGRALRARAAGMPQPLRRLFTDLADRGAQLAQAQREPQIQQQAHARWKELVDAFAQRVRAPCEQRLAGRYPFAASGEDAALADVEGFFGPGGAVDQYFAEFLRDLVETSHRPWKYRRPNASPAAADGDGEIHAAMLELLRHHGPDPEWFARAARIRQALFKAGTSGLGWDFNLQVAELDPQITTLRVQVDGRTLSYAHGPLQTWRLSWPGSRGGATAGITALAGSSGPRSGDEMSTSGAWAWLRLLERGSRAAKPSAGDDTWAFDLHGRRAVLGVQSVGPDPLQPGVARGFTCPR